jgi:hypothetical protein
MGNLGDVPTTDATRDHQYCIGRELSRNKYRRSQDAGTELGLGLHRGFWMALWLWIVILSY